MYKGYTTPEVIPIYLFIFIVNKKNAKFVKTITTVSKIDMFTKELR